MNELRLLIVAEDPLARAGLAAMLGDQPGYVVAGQTAAKADMIAALEAFRPDVLIWDLGWDPEAALEDMAQLREFSPPIVALLPDETLAAQVRAAGAGSLLPRDVDISSLLSAVAAVATGMEVFSPQMAQALMADRNTPQLGPSEALTPRELEVLRLLAEGLPNKAIAYQLDVSEHTVKFHVTSILSKLDARSRTEAVVRASRLGLVPL